MSSLLALDCLRTAALAGLDRCHKVREPRPILAAPTPNYRRPVNRTCRIIRVVDHTANDNSLAIPTFLLRGHPDCCIDSNS